MTPDTAPLVVTTITDTDGRNDTTDIHFISLYILKLKDLRYILKKTPLTSNLKSNGSMVAVFVVPKIHQKQEIVHRAGHEHYQMIIQDMRQLDIGYCINNIGGELRRS